MKGKEVSSQLECGSSMVERGDVQIFKGEWDEEGVYVYQASIRISNIMQHIMC